jgi:bacteriochlorophyllide a dehydrogenase
VTRAAAIAFTGRDRVELVEISVPDLRPDEVLVETELTAISQGTDRAMVTGSYRGVQDRYPFIYGYSRVGHVLETGTNVRDLAVGDQVFVGMGPSRLDPQDGFGETAGAYTSLGVIHRSDVVRLPATVEATTAALGALAAIAYQGVVTSNVLPRARVLVAGLGAIGQFSALMSALVGAQVWAMDPIAERRMLAKRLSRAQTLEPGDDIAAQVAATAWGTRPWRGRNDQPASQYEAGRWAGSAGALDVVIDATGRADALEAYTPLLTREGTLCLQGYYPELHTLDFHPAHLKRLTIRCPGGMDQVDYETAIRLLSVVDAAPLVGRVISIDDVPQALPELVARPPSDVVVALIRWRPTGAR